MDNNENKIAIIPVAGIGTRLRPHTHTQPKALVPVAGKPIVGHIIDSVTDIGIKDFVFIIGYMGDKIKKYIKENYGQYNLHFVTQKEMKGTAHAVLLTKKYVKSPALLIWGDTIIKGDLSKGMNDTHDACLGTKLVDDPRRFGVVEKRGNFVVKLIEKPDYIKKSEALVGVYFINNYKLLFDSIEELIKRDIKTKGEYQITDAFQIMVEKKAKITTFPIEGWYDCGKIDALLKTNQYLLKEKSTTTRTIIRGTNVIIPPAFISTSAKVSNSIIGPFASIGDDTIIDHSIIENSIISDNSSIRNIQLTESIIGQEAEVNGKPNKLNLGDNSTFNHEE